MEHTSVCSRCSVLGGGIHLTTTKLQETSGKGPLQAERFGVLLKTLTDWRILFSVQFERIQGQLGYYVHLPYFAHTQGVLQKAVFELPRGGEGIIRLREGGTTTSMRVKFAHHASGEAHFSQDRGVYTSIRTRTARLRECGPHVFTVHVFGADGFSLARQKDFAAPSANRASVYFEDVAQTFHPSQIDCRIFAHIYPIRHVSKNPMLIGSIDYSHAVRLNLAVDEERAGIVLFPPNPRPDDFCIILFYMPMERQPQREGPSLVFLGGFDQPDRLSDPDSPVTFLALHYTARGDDWRGLVKDLGSIDYPREA